MKLTLLLQTRQSVEKQEGIQRTQTYTRIGDELMSWMESTDYAGKKGNYVSEIIIAFNVFKETM